jgi:superfamily II DNA or RNA helicase
MQNLLSFDSPINEHPKDISIVLKNHQLAMLKKCIQIENIPENKYGIMNDKPGTGKTYVILSIIYENRHKEGTNIIVVPQNIYSQWVSSIEKFSNKLTYKKFINYDYIISLYSNPNSILETNIVLTTSSYYHHIATTLASSHVTVNRIFFDEIDSISNIIQTDLKSKFIWFVSASFQKESLGYFTHKLSGLHIDNITCKCYSEFVDYNILLEEPLKTYYLCKNIYVDNILEHVLSHKELLSINAMDYTLANQDFEKKKAKNEKDVIEIILKNRKLKIEFEKTKIKECCEKIDFFKKYNDTKLDCSTNFKKQIDNLELLYGFKEKILNLINNFDDNTKFYLEINVEDREIIEIMKEKRREEIKFFKNSLDDMMGILYNNNEIDKKFDAYLKNNGRDKTISIGGIIQNLKTFNILLSGIHEIIYKLKESKITVENMEYKQDNLIIIFYENYIKTKSYISDLISSINDFEYMLISDYNLDLYQKVLNVTEKNLKENEMKIKLLYERLTENNCCPICYELFDTIDSKNIYITPACCNNKVCELCVNNWYDISKKTSCIFCNTESVEKNSFYLYEQENIVESEVKLNKDKIDEEKINYEIVNINKQVFLNSFINKLKIEDKKVIIFSDYSNIFEYIQTVCDENEIMHVDLDKGNMKDIDKAVLDYKYGNAKVLLSNSTLFGCGMNFENSSDIIFVHKMANEMEKQVIGRAQRLGRKGQLKIIYLQYENESDLIIRKVNHTSQYFCNEEAGEKELNLESYMNEKQYYDIINCINENDIIFNPPDFDNVLNSYTEDLPPIPSEIIDVNLDQLIESLQ